MFLGFEDFKDAVNPGLATAYGWNQCKNHKTILLRGNDRVLRGKMVVHRNSSKRNK